jgi:methylated-DNA-[protein]-cysteine S-methyltransferase
MHFKSIALPTMVTYYNSPVGLLEIKGNTCFITNINFVNQKETEGNRWFMADELCHQLNAYFEGKLKVFDIPLQPSGTKFQMKVWDFLHMVPYGSTVSYAKLAIMMGNPGADRAVGFANSKNPLPIVIPCHRVIGSHGRLTGYAGGLNRKQHLLSLEGAYPYQQQLSLF